MYLLTITSVFLSTPSARRATFVPSRLLWEHFEFLSTALREEATGFGAQTPSADTISIHALREEGDRTRRQMVSGSSNFYPRPPRGGRPLARLVRADGTLFLSTPPRGGRPGCTTADGNAEVISIHALREEATHPPVGGGDVEGISIHALREEGDVRKGRKMQWYGSFLSTPSARRAT